MNFYKLNTLHNEDPVKETEQKLPRAPFNHDDITPTSGVTMNLTSTFSSFFALYCL